MPTARKPTDWHKKYNNAKASQVVTLHTDFAGAKAGMELLISSPADIATYVARIPHGETRTIARLRTDLSRAAKADATCPVTTSILLKVAAERAFQDIADSKNLDDVPPFWRVIEPNSNLAAKLSCGKDGIEHLLRLDGYFGTES
jgi:hypothetical protein